MRLAYVTTDDASDISAWSGSVFYILRALQQSGFQTECIGPLKEKYALLTKSKRIFYRTLFKNYFRNRAPIELANYANQVEKRLKSGVCDCIFSPGTIPLAYLNTDIPFAFWTDSTFAGMINFYPDYTNLCRETINDGNTMEQLALSKCRLAIYSSEWAAKSAVDNYDVDPEKVKFVPYGANIECERTFSDIDALVENKSFDICNLLFVGAHWHRKGGNKALEVGRQLNARGLKTELHIVGCNPPVELPSFARSYGYVSKRTQEGRLLIDKLMSEAHFLIVPSTAECYGVVFAEASSFGLPSIATNVGGITSSIIEGRNGYTFELDAAPDVYCDLIETLMSSKEQYRNLAKSSFREYSTRLNWGSAGKEVRELMMRFCGPTQR